MTQTSPGQPSPTQLDLIAEPKASSPQTVREDLVPPNIQSQCVDLLAELLDNVLKATLKGGPDER